MSLYVIALIWIAVSFSIAGFIGRYMRFGMTGELTPPVRRPSVSTEIVALH